VELGFDTIGNATIIAYDREPVLVTDPWVEGSAYFGSWALSHEVPAEQVAAVRSARYAWFSHGHPDHLNAESLPRVRGATILVPDHVGGRVQRDLVRDGFRVEVLPDRRWRRLSPRIKVLSIADYNQDGILLIDVGGRLLVDLNDASNRGWGRFVRTVVRQYPVAFLLALEGFGDADMINLFDEHGTRLRPDRATFSRLGPRIATRLASYGIRYFVPFSSMHRYQREDSAWAREHTTQLADYRVGFESRDREILPAFIRYDCLHDHVTELAPRERPAVTLSPAVFGDDWSEPLEREDIGAVEAYFRSIEHLRTFLDFVAVRVGGREHVVELTRRGFGCGVTFEAPRHSLTTAVTYRVFDDLLIGNFMRTIFNGRWPQASLYPDFTPYVAKYADNADARTPEEIRRYFDAYRERAPRDFLQHQLSRRLHGIFEEGAINAVRSFVPPTSPAYRLAKRVYRSFKKPPVV
jgi:hypothetical protein